VLVFECNFMGLDTFTDEVVFDVWFGVSMCLIGLGIFGVMDMRYAFCTLFIGQIFDR